MVSKSQLTSALIESAVRAGMSCTGTGVALMGAVGVTPGIGAGNGKPVPGVSPAQAKVAMNPINRQLPRNRNILVIVTFPLYARSLPLGGSDRRSELKRRHHSIASNYYC
jgi:hypothetical protein